MAGAAFYHYDALDALLILIRDNVDEIRLLDNYILGDDWSTVDSATIASAAIAPSDFATITTQGESRQMVFNGKTGSASGDSSVGELHIAIVDTDNSRVLAVTDETTNQSISTGNTVNFPSFYLQVNQPGLA